MKLMIHEIIDAVKAAKTKEEKINILKKNDSWALRDVLRGTLDEKVGWELPGGKPPYEPNEEYSIPSNLLKKNPMFKYFVKGNPATKDLKPLRRERMFIELLESIHPRDAELVVQMINKEKFGGGITVKLVNAAFPALVSS